MLVVHSFLLFILEDLVGLRNRLELGLGLFAEFLAYFVGVVLQCELEVNDQNHATGTDMQSNSVAYLAIGLLDVILAGRSVDFEELCRKVSNVWACSCGMDAALPMAG